MAIHSRLANHFTGEPSFSFFLVTNIYVITHVKSQSVQSVNKEMNSNASSFFYLLASVLSDKSHKMNQLNKLLDPEEIIFGPSSYVIFVIYNVIFYHKKDEVEKYGLTGVPK